MRGRQNQWTFIFLLSLQQADSSIRHILNQAAREARHQIELALQICHNNRAQHHNKAMDIKRPSASLNSTNLPLRETGTGRLISVDGTLDWNWIWFERDSAIHVDLLFCFHSNIQSLCPRSWFFDYADANGSPSGSRSFISFSWRLSSQLAAIIEMEASIQVQNSDLDPSS